jgi:hypothetical protein
MDNEEILLELNKLINWIGPAGEQIFDLAVAYERNEFFAKLRILIQQKDLAGDQTAVDVLNWVWQALAK